MRIILKLKEKVIAFKQSNNKLLQFTFIGLLTLKNIAKFIVSSSYKEQLFSKIRYRKHFHQFSHYTETNRYPDLFEICKIHFKDQKAPNILSFGCSTGQEVFSLGNYLPNSTITGTDISHWCIKECNKKNIDKRFVFLQSTTKQFDQLNKFDVIFCLAVFQHYANREKSVTTARKYVFSQFEAQLLILDKKLQPGGSLFIDNCDFDFMETSLAVNYYPMEVINNKKLQQRPLFNKYNNKISSVTNCYRIFIKL